jgi:hypothetical protein
MELIEKYVQRIQRRYKIPRDNLAISASNYPPYNPAKGQLWYNTADSDLYIWEQSSRRWVPIRPEEVSIGDGLND